MNEPTRRIDVTHLVARAIGPTPSAELALGSVIKDRFVIESQIGRGGKGIVYRACDLRKWKRRTTAIRTWR